MASSWIRLQETNVMWIPGTGPRTVECTVTGWQTSTGRQIRFPGNDLNYLGKYIFGLYLNWHLFTLHCELGNRVLFVRDNSTRSQIKVFSGLPFAVKDAFRLWKSRVVSVITLGYLKMRGEGRTGSYIILLLLYSDFLLRWKCDFKLAKFSGNKIKYRLVFSKNNNNTMKCNYFCNNDVSIFWRRAGSFMIFEISSFNALIKGERL